jgi:hypothetical protein
MAQSPPCVAMTASSRTAHKTPHRSGSGPGKHLVQRKGSKEGHDPKRGGKCPRPGGGPPIAISAAPRLNALR